MCLFCSPPPQTQQEMTEETGPWAGRSLAMAMCSGSQQLTFHLHGNLTMLPIDWRAAPEDASCLNITPSLVVLLQTGFTGIWLSAWEEADGN